MPNQRKTEWVEDLTESMKESPDMVFTDYKGLTVEEMETLRRELYDHDSRYCVVKNRLAELAF
ncbi:MAG: 50S ribosomal protein L10, partial [bacterium]